MALFYRSLFFFLGIFILTFGICLTIKAELGVGAWDALNVALTEWIGLTIGTWVIIDGAVLLFVNAILLKKKTRTFSAIDHYLYRFIGRLLDSYCV